MTTPTAGRGRAVADSVGALVGASHPLPSAAVTAFSVAVSAALGRAPGGALLTGAAVLAGQLSIGWSNDLLDRARDERAGRHDKPVADGRLAPQTVAAACGVAAVACVPLSFASGWAAGAVHLVAVGGGWAYNLGLKRTRASWLPFALSFALLTAFLTLGAPGHHWPQPWALATGALLGVGAHFLNVVPDIADDLAAGVQGLPQRLGPRRAAVSGAALLLAATTLVVLGPAGPTPWWAWAGLAVAGVTAGGAATVGLRGRHGRHGREPFLLAVATAAVAVVLVVARGSDLG
ncbi:MAG TPA: UbiA family prenyltransferase [Actinomycetes bacterium]